MARTTYRPVLAAAALLAAVTLLPGANGTARGAEARASTHSAVQASGTEYRIGLSRTKVKPGSVRVEFVNFGEDEHDLAVMRKGGSSAHNLGVVQPGGRAAMTVKVKRGSYVFWCTLSDHKAKGMRAVLKVRS